jgi:hypothetical protein
MRIWQLILLACGYGCVIGGVLKNLWFFRSGRSVGRIEMGREAISEIFLFGLGSLIFFVYIASRDRTRQSIFVPTWCAVLLLVGLVAASVYMIIAVLPT